MMAITLSPYYAGMDTAALSRVYLIWNVLSEILFVQMAGRDDTGPGANALLPVNLWQVQVLAGAAFIVFNGMVVKDSPKGAGMF